jgi:hypothetical protein
MMRTIRPVFLSVGAVAAWFAAVAPSARAEYPGDDDDDVCEGGCQLPPSASGLLESGGWTIDPDASFQGNPHLAAYTAWVGGEPAGRVVELPWNYGDNTSWTATYRDQAGWRWSDGGGWPEAFELRPEDGEDMEPVGGTASWYGDHELQPTSFSPPPPVGARIWRFTAAGSATTLGYLALQSDGLRWIVLPAGVQNRRLVPDVAFTFTEVSSAPLPILKAPHYEAFDEVTSGAM